MFSAPYSENLIRARIPLLPQLSSVLTHGKTPAVQPSFFEYPCNLNLYSHMSTIIRWYLFMTKRVHFGHAVQVLVSHWSESLSLWLRFVPETAKSSAAQWLQYQSYQRRIAILSTRSSSNSSYRCCSSAILLFLWWRPIEVSQVGRESNGCSTSIP
jgi:hypothetical protein